MKKITKNKVELHVAQGHNGYHVVKTVKTLIGKPSPSQTKIVMRTITKAESMAYARKYAKQHGYKFDGFYD